MEVKKENEKDFSKEAKQFPRFSTGCGHELQEFRRDLSRRTTQECEHAEVLMVLFIQLQKL